MTLSTKKLFAKMLTEPYAADVLYEGSKKTGTFSLSGNPSDYDFIQIASMTNTEYFVDVIYTGQNAYAGTAVKFSHQNGTGQYHSALNIAFGSNAMNATVNYNNVNWQLGVIKVVGIKLH